MDFSNRHIYMFQNPPLELSKYQTLPGKRIRKSELRPELNGEGGCEYLSPVQLSPLHDHEQDYSLSESTVQCSSLMKVENLLLPNSLL